MTEKISDKERDDAVQKAAQLCKLIYDSVPVTGKVGRKNWKENKESISLIIDTYLAVSVFSSEAEFNSMAGLPVGVITRLLRINNIEAIRPSISDSKKPQNITSEKNEDQQKKAEIPENIEIEKPSLPCTDLTGEAEIMTTQSTPKSSEPTAETPQQSSIEILENGDIVIKKVVVTTRILVRGSKEHLEFIKRITIPSEFQITSK